MSVTVPPEMTRDQLHNGGTGFLRLESVDATKNRFRFYTFTWQQTLWGEWAVCCSWGRIGSLGRSRIAYLGHRRGLPYALADLEEHRVRRGYRRRCQQSEGSSADGAGQAARRGPDRVHCAAD